MRWLHKVSFLRDHFFPRVEWARLLLSFRKLRLFARSLKALGVIHEIGGLVRVLDERVEKIARWPKPTNQSEVRGFLGTVVDQVENATLQDASQIIFDYSLVEADLPRIYIWSFLPRVYDNLEDPRHKCLFTADIKHAYHMVPFHEDDRHSFAFTYNPQSSSRHGFHFNSSFPPPPEKQANKQINKLS